MKMTMLLLTALAALLLAACSTDPQSAQTCRERAELSGNTNELFYCPEDFEGPLAPPAEDEGVQIVYGPYEQTEAESEMCMTLALNNPEPIMIRQYTARMRPGSHHFLLYRTSEELPDGVYYPCFAGTPSGGVAAVPEFVEAGVDPDAFSGRLSWLAGLQAPGNLATPDYEDLGLAFVLPANANLILNVHYVNVTGAPITQEVWVNTLFTREPEKVQEEIAFITLIGAPIAIPPRTEEHVVDYYGLLPLTEMDEYEAETGEPLDSLKIHLLTAHAHRRLLDFEIVIERADGSEEAVYYTDNWYEPEYVHFNPPLEVFRGDKVRYTCRWRNDDDHTVYLGELVDDEMCNVFGAYSPSLGGNWLNGLIRR